ncbi:MAG: DUF4468 domain-containing protein [Bacteroidales bacterium]|nr:DUF4468 domain-containing protein [Bacteroidales bacterium]
MEMKPYGFILLGVLCGLYAQLPIDSITQKITYKEVVQVEGSKDSLYNRAIAWIHSYFKNPQGVTKVRDPQNGLIIGDHRIRMVDTQKDGSKINSNTVVEYTFKIELKDGKYRYTFTDFEMKATSKFPLERWLNKADPSYSPLWETYIPQVDEHIREVIQSLKKGMQPKKKVKDEW